MHVKLHIPAQKFIFKTSQKEHEFFFREEFYTEGEKSSALELHGDIADFLGHEIELLDRGGEDGRGPGFVLVHLAAGASLAQLFVGPKNR